jgi:fibronectin type 3 domain-containing protein
MENTLINPNTGNGPLPSPPVITLISPSFSLDGNVTIEWDPVPYADNYTVCRSACSFTCGPIATVTDTIFQEWRLTEGIYYYMVETNNESGYSLPSNPVYVVIDLPEPDAPDLDPITPNPNLEGNVYLNWNDVVDVNYYNIYRGTTPILNISTETPIGNSEESQYADIVLDSGVYYYVITAVGNGGESIASNIEAVNVDLRKIPGFSIGILLGIVGISVLSLIWIHKIKTQGD